MTEHKGPWRIISWHKPYSNPWIEVTHHDVIDPSGRPGTYGTVHFKNRALAILPIDDEGYTWLVGQYRFPLGRYSWEIPEGGGLLTEDPLEAAKRELREECGLSATHWERILEMDLSNSVTDESSISYLARGITHGDAQPDSTEALQVRRLPFTDVYQMVLTGEITDTLSVATILKAKALGKV